MSKLLSDLQRLLLAPERAVVQGTVSGVVLDKLLVATAVGMRQFKVANPGSYQVGDRVRFQGEIFLGRVADESGLPRYRV